MNLKLPKPIEISGTKKKMSGFMYSDGSVMVRMKDGSFRRFKYDGEHVVKKKVDVFVDFVKQ